MVACYNQGCLAATGGCSRALLLLHKLNVLLPRPTDTHSQKASHIITVLWVSYEDTYGPQGQ